MSREMSRWMRRFRELNETNQGTARIGEDAGKRERCALFSGMWNGLAAVEDSMGVP